MTLTVTIKMDNAAFDGSPEVEAARILDQVARRLYDGQGPCLDVNGNRVGAWKITGKREG